MFRKTLPAALIVGLLVPTASAGIADDYYPVLNFVVNTRGFNCATAARIAADFLGYECSLSAIQVTLTGNQCIAALQNTCVLAPTTLTVDELTGGDLVITEVMQNPLAVSDSAGEYFEVYNNAGADVDLEGLVVSDLGSDSFTVSGSLVVAAGDYVVFGKSTDTATNGGADVDYAFSTSMTLSNSDDEVVLSNSLGVMIDQVLYDGGATFPDPNGASMNLSADALDATDNDSGASWCESTAAYGDGDLGSPGAANEVCPSFTYTSADVQMIINAECAGCHTGGGTSGGLALDDINAVVNLPSVDVPTMDEIEPGDTASSYLWHKLQGTQAEVGGAGGQMPQGGTMSAADLAVIETWILEGAPE